MSKKYKISNTVDWQSLDDQIIILSLKNNLYYSINRSGKWFFEKILSGTGEDEIILQATEHFSDVGSKDLIDDFKSFILKLESMGILEPC